MDQREYGMTLKMTRGLQLETQMTMLRICPAFHFYDEMQKDFYVESGTFEIRVGSSSRDIRLIEEVEI